MRAALGLLPAGSVHQLVNGHEIPYAPPLDPAHPAAERITAETEHLIDQALAIPTQRTTTREDHHP